jgi:hypothetical protein
MLVMDEKVTSQSVLGEPGARGVKFLTLRMRAPALARHVNAVKPADFKAITLDRAAPRDKPARHEAKAVRLTSYPGTVRQLVVTGPGRDAATVTITNEHQATTRNLISQHARRITIEQRLAEITRSFYAGAVNVVLRHVRCPTLQKWPNRPTKIDRNRSILVGGYGPLLH